jgi:hypothetical protein
MFYDELANTPVSSLELRNPLPSLAKTQNTVQIRQLLIHTGGKANHRETLGGNTERT